MFRGTSDKRRDGLVSSHYSAGAPVDNFPWEVEDDNAGDGSENAGVYSMEYDRALAPSNSDFPTLECGNVYQIGWYVNSFTAKQFKFDYAGIVELDLSDCEAAVLTEPENAEIMEFEGSDSAWPELTRERNFGTWFVNQWNLFWWCFCAFWVDFLKIGSFWAPLFGNPTLW